MSDTPIFDRLFREHPLPQPSIPNEENPTVSHEHMRAVGHGGEQSDAYTEDQIDEVEGLAGRLQDLLPDDAIVVDWDIHHTSFLVTRVDRSVHPGQVVFQTDELTALERYVDHIEDPTPDSMYDGPRAEND